MKHNIELNFTDEEIKKYFLDKGYTFHSEKTIGTVVIIGSTEPIKIPSQHEIVKHTDTNLPTGEYKKLFETIIKEKISNESISETIKNILLK